MEEVTSPMRKTLPDLVVEENYFEDEVDEEEEAWYEEGKCMENGMEKGYEHEEYEDEALYEEEIPEEVEEALDETEDAFVNYMESRREDERAGALKGIFIP